jgi:hypothetical protein
MMKKWMIMLSAALLCLGWQSTAFGQRSQKLGLKSQQKIIESATGSFKRGWIVSGDRGEKVFIDISGEKMDLPANAKVLKIPDVEKEFAKKQRDVRDKDSDRTAEYVKLFDWARDRQLYEEVDKLADKILKRNPANPDPNAQRAKDWAKENLDLMQKTRTAGAEEGEWTMEKVQQIRFALIGTGAYEGAPVQIAFKGNVLDRFLEEMAQADKLKSRDEQRDFRGLSPLDQARIIKRETGSKYQADILISRDPKLIIDFRTRIQPLLARSCAQPSCHGGKDTKFQLLTRSASIPQIYANYYALDTYKGKDGAVIDHARPDIDSLLINYLVPVNLAPKELTHAPSIPPVIRARDDARYQQVLDWLKLQPKEPIDVLLGEKGEVKPPVKVGDQTTPPPTDGVKKTQ